MAKRHHEWKRRTIYSFICSEMDVVRTVKKQEKRRSYQKKNEIDRGIDKTSHPVYIGYVFHDLPSQFFSLFRPLAHSSLCQQHEEGGGNWWESDNRGYWVTKERQIDSYKTAEECEQFSSSLFQLGNVLHVIFLYLCTKFIDLCSDPSKSSITFFCLASHTNKSEKESLPINFMQVLFQHLL